MPKQIDQWEDIDWTKVRTEVFSIQKRIFTAAKGGDHARVLQLQRLLLNSFSARALAVRQVAQDNRGKRTPGTDGIHSLTAAQKFKLVEKLDIRRKPLPLRRTHRLKANGKLRPLSIPTIHDRVVQTLIAMTLEPQWEPRFPPHMYGFRRGRGVHDAINLVLSNIGRKPKWVLDADVASFFDNVDRGHLLNQLDTLPGIRRTIGQMLKSGHIEDHTWHIDERGIPQGGSLSPLLANILLSGFEKDLAEAFRSTRRINGITIGRTPRVVIYADDFVVLHDRRGVIEEVYAHTRDWLAVRGLTLSDEKIRIIHTLHRPNCKPFDFLGYRFIQRAVGRHQGNPWFNGILTLTRPSNKAVEGLKAKASEIIMQIRPNPKHNALYRHKRLKGQPDHQELIIMGLNPILRGWATHFRHGNSKEAFSDIDHWLWIKLWQWTKRHYGKRMNRHDLVTRFFNGGNPWTFRVHEPASGKPTELLKLASVEIIKHRNVQAARCYFDGDWIYWCKLRGHYPGIPPMIARTLRRQEGKCHRCRMKFEKGQQMTVERILRDDRPGHISTLAHSSCVISNR